ncbi:hypothetical protein F5Y14DRAFT_407931, partial [Nemania sp. NC0429]
MYTLGALQSQIRGFIWASDDPRLRTIWHKIQSIRGWSDSNLTYGIPQRGLRELLARPWFRRVWILQEVANARRALLCCGTASIDARIFALSPILLEVDLDEHLRAVFDLMPTYSQSGQRKLQDADFGSILTSFRGSEASDPRDKIFALVGLCADGLARELVRPDYTKHRAEATTAVVEYFLAKDFSASSKHISKLSTQTIEEFLKDMVLTKHGFRPWQYVKMVLVHFFSCWNMSAALSCVYHVKLRSYPHLLDYYAYIKVYIDLYSMLVGICRGTISIQRDKLDRVLLLASWGRLTDHPLRGVLQYHDHDLLRKKREARLFADNMHKIRCNGTQIWEALENSREIKPLQDCVLFTVSCLFGNVQTSQIPESPEPIQSWPFGGSASMVLPLAMCLPSWYIADILAEGTEIVVGELPSVLSWVIHSRDDTMIHILQRYRANIVGCNGRFPLHCAAEFESIQAVRFLLEQGFDSNVVDKDGRTALQVARDNERPGVVCLLEAANDGMLDKFDQEAAQKAEVDEAIKIILNSHGG